MVSDKSDSIKMTSANLLSFTTEPTTDIRLDPALMPNHWLPSYRPPYVVSPHYMLVKNDYKNMVKRVIYNDPATIVFWNDNTKTVVKCIPGEEFDPYYGFCAAVCKKIFGNSNSVRRAAGLPKHKEEVSQ